MSSQPPSTPPGVTDAATLAAKVRLFLGDGSGLRDPGYVALAELEALAARTQQAEIDARTAKAALAQCNRRYLPAALDRVEAAEARVAELEDELRYYTPGVDRERP